MYLSNNQTNTTIDVVVLFIAIISILTNNRILSSPPSSSLSSSSSLLLLLNEGFFSFLSVSLSVSYVLRNGLVHAKLPAAAASLLLNTLSTLYLCAVSSYRETNTGLCHAATRFKDKEDVGGKTGEVKNFILA